MNKKALTILFLGFLLSLILFSSSNLVAVKEGLALWANCVIPSLFPFFIATELLNYTNIAQMLGKLLNKIMRPLFNVPGEGAYALIMGILSGYPVGAKIVLDLYENKICTKNEAERMLAFTNNSGPLFIIGTVGILLFGNTSIGVLLLITHVLSSITTGIFLGISSKSGIKNFPLSEHNKVKKVYLNKNLGDSDIPDFGTIISLSIRKSISTILQIGGFVVFFSVVLSILNSSNLFNIVGILLERFHIPQDITKSFLSGFIELTNGVNLVACIQTKNISINIVLCAFLLGFGGLSVLLQVISITSKSNLSTKIYIKGKIMQGLFAALYTAILIRFMPIYNLDITTSLSTFSKKMNTTILFIVSLIVAFATIMLKSNLHHKIISSKYN